MRADRPRRAEASRLGGFEDDSAGRECPREAPGPANTGTRRRAIGDFLGVAAFTDVVLAASALAFITGALIRCLG